MLKDEAKEIKKCLDQDESENIAASNGWLGKWKPWFGVREIIVNGEADRVPEYAVSTWMERLLELKRDYEPFDIWNMDEKRFFLQGTSRKGFSRKKRE